MPSAVELLPYGKETENVAGQDVGPVEIRAKEKLERVARYLGRTLGHSVIVQ